MTLHFSDFPKRFGYSMSTKHNAERDILPERCLHVCRPSSLAACLASIHFDAREGRHLGMKMFVKEALDFLFLRTWDIFEGALDGTGLRGPGLTTGVPGAV
jgi:hypothetical protein